MRNEQLLKNKNILVVGLGRSGVAAIETSLRLGARVSVQDSKAAEDIDPKLRKCLEGKRIRTWFGRTPEDMGEYDILILSPGVPVDLPFINEARALGAEVIGELELAYRIGSGRYIGITGTNGKTTTTTLVGEIFKEAGLRTSVVGNIGVPVLTAAEDSDEESWLVTEVSSFQLETADEFRPEVSAILNLTPDHLNRHKTMANYGAAKARIFRRQSPDQYCVVNRDDEGAYGLAGGCPAKVVPFSRKAELDFGVFVRDEVITVRDEDGREALILPVDELKIPGSHNLENALAAAAIAYFAGIDPGIIGETMRSFSGVEHRIENCGQMDGVRFVNDSKGTNPDAAIKAIEAMKENIILIAGGYDKDADFTEFVRSFDGRVKHALLLGETAEKIRDAAGAQDFVNTHICEDMSACVEKAWQLATRGDVVLLSPACASWDMYKSFEQRGEDFKECVKRLEP